MKTREIVRVADTGLFVACGSTENEKFRALRRDANREGGFVIPERVHEELVGTPEEYDPAQGITASVDQSMEEGWVEMYGGIDYTNPKVSGAMDVTRRYIADVTDRSEHDIEKADAALSAVAVQILEEGEDVGLVELYTTDKPAGEGCVKAAEAVGYEAKVEFVYAFDYVD